MRWTVTLEVNLANLVAGRRALAEQLPFANLIPESRGGVQRSLTMSVRADTEAEASSIAVQQVRKALTGFISAAPRPISLFADPD